MGTPLLIVIALILPFLGTGLFTYAMMLAIQSGGIAPASILLLAGSILCALTLAWTIIVLQKRYNRSKMVQNNPTDHSL